MKREIKIIALIAVAAWLLLSLSGCERPCYYCSVLYVGVTCIKGNNTISGYVNGTIAANDSEYLNLAGPVVIGSVTDPNIGSGTNIRGYSLYVQYGILTEQVKVAQSSTADWSDFVFDKNYKLPTFGELDGYIKENKHLPGIPSADEVVCDGLDLGKMDAKLLQKIEELTCMYWS